MPPNSSRPRSSTSVSTASTRPRPLSRASTTSLHTTADHSVLDHRDQYPSELLQSDANARSGPTSISPEEMISRSESQLKNPDHSFGEDYRYQPSHSQLRAMSVDTAYSGVQEVYRPHIAPRYSHDSHNPQLTLSKDKRLQDDASKAESKKKPKAGSSNVANEQELRRLFRENCHLDLKQVAITVLANDRGPKSEKTKQIFAMNWLSIACKKSTTSVPRNRVYAQYAQRCGTERVPVLNPASFGKLVRIIFPDILTRRLGMRGESKYHYVDLALEADEPGHIHDSANPLQSNLHDGSVEFGQPGQYKQADVASMGPRNSAPPALSKPSHDPKNISRGHLFINRNATDIHKSDSRENMISRPLLFSLRADEPNANEAEVVLPELTAYVPPGTDLDTAGALKALYRSHCTSIIDSVRFCKEKSFWHHLTSFHGTLTVPVQKLFAHPNVAPWIRECDWLMYQKIIHLVSPLALQVMPEVVTNAFQSIADNLSRQLTNIFGGLPQHVQDAKHGPAIIFSNLMGRLLRVNAASHAAAHILGNDATREQMWHDWVHFVKPTVVAESCLPGIGYARCIKILANDLRDLLSPLNMKVYHDMQPIFHTTSVEEKGDFAPYNELDDSSTSSVLDRWVSFLNALPTRFPHADARTLLHCVSDVGTAALRDITMATAISFGQWTVTKVWVDEMLQWMAEKGGFLESRPSSTMMRPKKRSAAEVETASTSLDSGPMARPHKRTATQTSFESESQGPSSRPRTAGPETATLQVFRKPEYAPLISPTFPPTMSGFSGMPQISRDQNQEQHTNTRESFARPSSYYQQTIGDPSPTMSTFAQNELHHQSRRSSSTNLSGPQTTQEAHGSAHPELRKVPSYAQFRKLSKEHSYDDTHEDSGIGLDLDLPQQQTPLRIPDYAGYVVNTNSDPADVVVC